MVSIIIWLRQSGKFMPVTPEQVGHLCTILRLTFKTLAQRRIQRMESYLGSNLAASLTTPPRNSAIRASTVVGRWHKSPDRGGIKYQTHKAVCRRHGVYRTCYFDLIVFFTRGLATRWARFFGEILESGAANFISEDVLESFREFQEVVSKQLGITENSQVATDIVAFIQICVDNCKYWRNKVGTYLRKSGVTMTSPSSFFVRQRLL